MAAPLTDRLMPPSTRTRALAAIYHIPMAVIAPVLLVVQLIMMVLLWRWFEPAYLDAGELHQPVVRCERP